MSSDSLEARLWEAADQLRANSELKASQYSMPVLGLIFLKYADHKFKETTKELECKTSSRRRHVTKNTVSVILCLLYTEWIFIY